MRDEQWTERDPAPRLWRVRRGGGRLHPGGSRVVIGNAGRQPRGVCLVQYTVSGVLQVQRGGRAADCPAGFAALMWFGERSSYGPQPGPLRYESRWLNLDGPGLLEAWSDLIARSGGIIGPDRDGSLRRALDGLITRRPPRGMRERLELASAVWRLLLDLHARALTPGRDGVETAIAALRADPCGCGTLSALARRHGCSREHLSRRFAARHGLPPQRWLSAHRLEHARALLSVSGLSVAEIARRCGWSSARGLARALRHPPSRLRPPASAYRVE